MNSIKFIVFIILSFILLAGSSHAADDKSYAEFRDSYQIILDGKTEEGILALEELVKSEKPELLDSIQKSGKINEERGCLKSERFKKLIRLFRSI